MHLEPTTSVQQQSLFQIILNLKFFLLTPKKNKAKKDKQKAKEAIPRSCWKYFAEQDRTKAYSPKFQHCVGQCNGKLETQITRSIEV